MLYHSIISSTITSSITMSTELNITLADLQEAIERATAGIVQLLQVTQTTSGLMKMEAVQQLYRITVSISETFIHPQWIVSNICYRRNGLWPCGG